MNWNDLKHLHLTQKYYLFPRRKEVVESYDKFKSELNISIDEYIKCILNKIEGNIVIRKNDYPYDLEENILHYVVWMKGDESKEDVVNYLDNLTLLDYVLFENVGELKSVPEIRHYHLFLLEKDVMRLQI